MKVVGKFDDLLSHHRQDLGKTLLRLLISAAAMTALALISYFFKVPNPNIILLTGLTFFTAVYGFRAGIVSSVVMVLYSLFFFSEGHDWVTFTSVNLQKLAVIVFGAVVNTLLVGGLKRQELNAVRQLSEINRLLRVDNQNLEEASLTDALTGTRNRFGLRQDYNRFENRYVHVMMLDLDDFKRINDTFGHAVGDFLLKRVGQLLIDTFGASACYRYGGDEFLIICIDADPKSFPDKLNALRQGMNGIYLNDRNLPARFSAGYVYGDCEFSHDLRLMMHQADGNLYEAKRAGRNQWVGDAFSRDKAERAEHTARFKERQALGLSDVFPV